jgi:predicted nucleic acid-binding protein
VSVPQPIRAYVDTSVFGGVFDDEFAEASRSFFLRVDKGEITVLVGRTTEAELARAPERVAELLGLIAQSNLERIGTTPEMLALCEAYLQSGVVARKWQGDAMQVATATVSRADVLVSWNFRHIVRFDRMRAFNAVNFAKGYPYLSISSPAEVRYAGQDEEI